MSSGEQLYNQRQKKLHKLIQKLELKILELRTLKVASDPLTCVNIGISIHDHNQDLEEAKKELAEVDKAIAISGVQSAGVGDECQNLQVSQSFRKIGVNDELYYTLLTLDYKDQSTLFRRFTQSGDGAAFAFVIQGSRYHGQRWLLNRLAKTCNLVTDKIVRFPLKRLGRSNDINALWRELAKQVGLEGKDLSLSGAEIAKYVCNWLQTQNVILIFNDIQRMSSGYFATLIEEFWQPLVKNAANCGSDSQLLMFLVDNTGEMCTKNIDFTEAYTVDWNRQKPIKLPILNKFTETILSGWFKHSGDVLPLNVIDEIDNSVESILENCEGGTPEYVFEEICSLCDRDWHEETKKWLKL
ncbi:MAG: hypothetical protein AAF915_30280 [Cyanobacteria bacterium P01_D01_bin.50]